MLQLLEHVLLAFAVTGDVGDRPHRVAGVPFAVAERPNPHPQPTAMRADGAGKANLFLKPLALARGLEQAEHGFRHVGIADEDPLHRPHVLRTGRAGERKIGRVGIDDIAALIGDRQTVEGMIGDPAHHRIIHGPVGEPDDPGRKGEQVEQPNHREQRQQAHNIRLCLGPADGGQRHRHGDDAGGDQ